jgi:spore germination protein GerM
MRRISSLAVVLLAATAIGGCGVGAQRAASRTPPADVPFGLLSPTLNRQTVSPSAKTQTIVLYLLRGRRLAAVTRAVLAPATFAARLQALGTGPTPGESAHGLTSAVSDQSPGPTGTVRADRATINLPADFEQLTTDDQIEALAQLVYTATALPGVEVVNFTIDRARVPVPRANNTTAVGPVSRADYGSLAPHS